VHKSSPKKVKPQKKWVVEAPWLKWRSINIWNESELDVQENTHRYKIY